ncbi:MAG: hypothetical protein HY898_06645 [Deltaproteobacteria bacterium]|nr:hypothetical protein [Deltaproteobacteria bacterium]
MRTARFAPLLVLLVAACDHWPGVGGDGGLTPGSYHMEDNSGNIGSACSDSKSCNLPIICVKTAPNGLCTKACTTDSDCAAAGASCVNAFSSGFICVKNCQSDQMCREGYACLSGGSSMVCLKDPLVGADL